MELLIRKFDSFEAAEAAEIEDRIRMPISERINLFFKLRELFHTDGDTQGLTRVYRVLELERS
jgi:hypothetical protein